MALKEKALKRLTEKLTKACVSFCLGGDWMLSQRGVDASWHGFYVYTTEAAFEQADGVLTRLGMREDHSGPNGPEVSYHFDGADVTLRAAEVICGRWHARWDGEAPDTAAVLGVQVPLMSLEEAYVRLWLSGSAQAATVEAALRNGGCQHSERFAAALAEPLPEALETKLNELKGH